MKLTDKITYVEKLDSDFTSIKVLQNPYKGVIYTYGKVKIIEPDNTEGTAKLSFDYLVEEVPPILGKTKEEIEKEDQFKQYIGDILVQVFEEEVARDERHTDDNSTDDN